MLLKEKRKQFLYLLALLNHGYRHIKLLAAVNEVQKFSSDGCFQGYPHMTSNCNRFNTDNPVACTSKTCPLHPFNAAYFRAEKAHKEAVEAKCRAETAMVASTVKEYGE